MAETADYECPLCTKLHMQGWTCAFTPPDVSPEAWAALERELAPFNEAFDQFGRVAGLLGLKPIDKHGRLNTAVRERVEKMAAKVAEMERELRELQAIRCR